MPCLSSGPNRSCAFPIFLSQSKNVIAFSASTKTFVLAQKPNLVNGNHLLGLQQMFKTGTKCISIFGLAQNFLKTISEHARLLES
jgi:hypothetical protein